MSRWPARILGIVMLVFFALIMFRLYKQLVILQQMQQPAATSSR